MVLPHNTSNMKQELYAMKLGEKIKFDIWDVWRVPGGWIFALDAGTSAITTFVPFNSEFQLI